MFHERPSVIGLDPVEMVDLEGVAAPGTAFIVLSSLLPR